MPLKGNDTDGAVTRKRLETWVAKEEKVTVVAATDAATTQSAATLAAAGHVVYTMTPTTGRALTTPTSFEFTVVNVAATTHAITLTAGASGVTLGGVAGMATVAAASSATFLAVFTAANTVTIYRK